MVALTDVKLLVLPIDTLMLLVAKYGETNSKDKGEKAI